MEKKNDVENKKEFWTGFCEILRTDEMRHWFDEFKKRNKISKTWDNIGVVWQKRKTHIQMMWVFLIYRACRLILDMLFVSRAPETSIFGFKSSASGFEFLMLFWMVAQTSIGIEI